jgi:hypothetical protein
MVVTDDADSSIDVFSDKEYYHELIKRLNTILGLVANADEGWSERMQKWCQQVYRIIKKHQRFFLDDGFFAIHNDKPMENVNIDYIRLCSMATKVLELMSLRLEEGKTRLKKLKVLKLAKKLLGAIEKATEKAMEVLHPNHAAILAGDYIEYLAHILSYGDYIEYLAHILSNGQELTREINKELLVLNLRLRNRDPEVFLIVKELEKHEHGIGRLHTVPTIYIGSFLEDLQEGEGGGSSDDVVWQALCSVIPSRVPLDRCEGCECDNVEEEFHAFSVCAQCKTAVYCSKKCQRAHWKEGHKTTCHPSATGGV